MTDPIVSSNSSDASERGPHSADVFEAGAQKKQRGMIFEFWDFLAHSRSWWLIPITVAVLLLGFALLVGTGPLAPLLYALF